MHGNAIGTAVTKAASQAHAGVTEMIDVEGVGGGRAATAGDGDGHRVGAGHHQLIRTAAAQQKIMGRCRAGNKITTVDATEQLRCDVRRPFLFEDEHVAFVTATDTEILEGGGGRGEGAAVTPATIAGDDPHGFDIGALQLGAIADHGIDIGVTAT